MFRTGSLENNRCGEDPYGWLRAIGPSFLLTLCASGGALAQGTGTVASPSIKPGTSLSVAAGYAEEDGVWGEAHRVDVRHAVNARWRFGAMAFFNDRGGDYRYRRLALEVMHQFDTREPGWNSALQVRGRLPDGNEGPGRVRVAWLNRWRFNSGPELRLIGLASHEFGEDRAEGLRLETRSEATWRIGSDLRLGAQMFNRYNSTSEFGSFKSQRHAIGGVLKGPLSERLSYRLNALTGVSEAAADFEIRLRIRATL